MATIGIEFTETMRGTWQDGKPFEFTLTVRGEDLYRMLGTPGHEAAMSGLARVPGLSAKPLAVSDGVFQLFVPDPDQPEARNMLYRMRMRADDGRAWYFSGKKTIRQNSPLDVWRDTSTLAIAVHETADPASPILGTGVLHIEPADFAMQMTTLKILNAANDSERLRGIAAFGRFFAGTLFQTYGGVFARSTAFDPAAPPRQKRALKAGTPSVHPFRTEDGVNLRLTRYRGGDKGPVILCHGLGVSSLIFALDTVETNLVEYLHANRYDVWLLDFRNSIELPASRDASSGDEVATRDYPAAVAKVREVTGAPNVQMVVHCWGSTTFFMAMLAGLQGVRSAVCSQIATHFVTPPATQVKTGLHLPSMLDALGVRTLSAFASTQEEFNERLLDAALSFYPVRQSERCNSPTCHRISFMYAPLYRHDQLNAATHETLHETFGVANMKAFEHLALLARTGHLVDSAGRDSYLPHLDRLDLPLTFIHGADNECFLSESTRITYDLLVRKFGGGRYRRHVIPDYGHIDCIFGRNAAKDVYPKILESLGTA